MDHASAQLPKRVLSDSEREAPDSANYEDEVSDQCAICIAFAGKSRAGPLLSDDVIALRATDA